ncbi:MAG: DNA polymerase III subunit delta [Planctomycetota bacterium]
MSKSTNGIDFLLAPKATPPGSLCAVSGDEAFLKREVLHAIRRQVCGDDQGDFAWNVFSGREAEWRDVHDALSAVSLFGGGVQAALVEDADSFVTAHRQQLEDYVAKPPAGAVLVLEVKTWNGSTRLAKAAAAANGLALKCQVPDRGAEVGAYKRQVVRWLTERATSQHETTLEPAAAEVLLDLLPLSLGVLDQEVAKLALLAGDRGAIDATLVQEQVGGWRTRKTWDMIDAMADGDAADALGQLDRLLLAGEQPIGLLAQISSTLRKFSAAACLFSQAQAAGRRGSLRQALEQAGVIKFKLGDAERQLKQIGRDRAAKLDRWLLDADLAMKGHNSTPARARMELERLVVRLSHAADARRA